jgi:hypothetical protein
VFTKEFWWIMMVLETSQSYLGMQISVTGGEEIINIRYYLQNILVNCNNLQVVVTPETKGSFIVE